MSVNMLDARAKLAAVLTNGSVPVYTALPDAVSPPCVALGWRIPMIDWATQQTRASAFGVLGVTLIGGRLEAEEGIAAIEQMYDSAQRAMRADGEGWSVGADSGVISEEIGGVSYLLCRLEVRVPLAI